MKADATILMRRHPELKRGEVFADKLPNPSCRHCYGRGTDGGLLGGLYRPCRCLGAISSERKLKHHVGVDDKGRVVPVTRMVTA